MPLTEAFDKFIESQIADMKNVGPGEGGSITAAAFIQRFVESGVKWAHLDIAGTVWADKAGTLHDKGATGFGVALLVRLGAEILGGGAPPPPPPPPPGGGGVGGGVAFPPTPGAAL